MSRKKPLKIESPEVLYHQPVREKQGYKSFEARTPNQKEFVRSIVANPISIAIGPPGGGKTACAIGMACYLLDKGKIDKIVISRPAVPVFEQIGFEPGNKNEKMLPYIMPMKKEFGKFMPVGEFDRLLKEEVIEIVPLCYLQGWNIDDGQLLIVDECGLLTYPQFSLILSRICKEGRIILMGDPAQDGGTGDGQSFDAVARKLAHLKNVGVTRFTAEDNQRHELVNAIQRILVGSDSRAPIGLEDRLAGYTDGAEMGKEWKNLYHADVQSL